MVILMLSASIVKAVLRFCGLVNISRQIAKSAKKSLQSFQAEKIIINSDNQVPKKSLPDPGRDGRQRDPPRYPDRENGRRS